MMAGRFVFGLAAVAILIAIWILAQGIGEAVGSGIREWMVR